MTRWQKCASCGTPCDSWGKPKPPLSSETIETLEELLGLAEMYELSGYQKRDRTVNALKEVLTNEPNRTTDEG